MTRLIDISEEELLNYTTDILSVLLKDRTTGRNILWATDDYKHLGEAYDSHKEIFKELITGHNKNVIQPRILKNKEKQVDRTKKNAEVFTPSWICNAQNNLIDDAWFGRKGVFNTEKEQGWVSSREAIVFDKKGSKTWQKYVDAKRLEIACGEAPYLVSRYNAATGEYIKLMDRIGLLDRKLRVVSENTSNETEWLIWSKRAIESIYGFEFQGDSLLLARENILFSFVDYMEFALNRKPTVKELKDIATVISWNVWQMDGRKYSIPYSNRAKDDYRQITLFDIFQGQQPIQEDLCKIKDWRAKEILEFRSLVKEKRR